MRINIYLTIVASFAAFSAATPTYLGYPDISYSQPLVAYSPDLFSGASIQAPLSFGAPEVFGTPYDYYTGPGTSQLGGEFPHFFYPGVESPAVEIARKKASNSVDKIAAGQKVDTKAKDPCDILKDAFGKGGVHNFYSLDNGPVYIGNGFDFNAIPPVATLPFGYDPFGQIPQNGKTDSKIKIPDDKPSKADDDTIAIDRKITLSVPGASDTTDSVLNPAAPDATSDNSATPAPNAGDGTNEDSDQTISPLAPSTDAPETTQASADAGGNTDNTAVNDARKRKRQNVRVRALRKL